MRLNHHGIGNTWNGNTGFPPSEHTVIGYVDKIIVYDLYTYGMNVDATSGLHK